MAEGWAQGWRAASYCAFEQHALQVAKASLEKVPGCFACWGKRHRSVPSMRSTAGGSAGAGAEEQLEEWCSPPASAAWCRAPSPACWRARGYSCLGAHSAATCGAAARPSREAPG